MLHRQSLPKFSWGEVANTIVYVQNRCPHQALDTKTPAKVFSNMQHDVSHFRIFGSLVYFQVLKEKRSKLDVGENDALGKIRNLPIPRKSRENRRMIYCAFGLCSIYICLANIAT